MNYTKKLMLFLKYGVTGYCHTIFRTTFRQRKEKTLCTKEDGYL